MLFLRYDATSGRAARRIVLLEELKLGAVYAPASLSSNQLHGIRVVVSGLDDGDGDDDAAEDALAIDSSSSSVSSISLLMTRIGPILNGDARKVVFDLSIQEDEETLSSYVDVKDTWDDGDSKGAGANLRKANPENECEIGSPLVGKVEDVVSVGTIAKQGSKTMILFLNHLKETLLQQF